MGGSSGGNNQSPPPPPAPPEAQEVSGLGVAGQGRGAAEGDVFGRREMADVRARRRGRAANILTMLGGQRSMTGGTGVRTLLGGGGSDSNP